MGGINHFNFVIVSSNRYTFTTSTKGLKMLQKIPKSILLALVLPFHNCGNAWIKH